MDVAYIRIVVVQSREISGEDDQSPVHLLELIGAEHVEHALSRDESGAFVAVDAAKDDQCCACVSISGAPDLSIGIPVHRRDRLLGLDFGHRHAHTPQD